MPVNYIPHPIRAELHDEIGARALNTGGADNTHVYQNTQLRPILVVVTLHCISNGAGLLCRGIGTVGVATPPGGAFAYGGWEVSPGGGEVAHFSTMLMVPAGWYYKYYRNIGVGEQVELNEWWEIYL